MNEKEVYARAFTDIVRLLCPEGPNRNPSVAIWALSYELGLATALTSKNPSQKAKELGVSRAYMSYWRCYWRENLPCLKEQ
jgi:hypothetical protein